MKLALVGCGGMGRRHIGGTGRLNKVGKLNFELAAVCDMLPENAALAADVAAENLDQRPEIYHDFDGMLSSAQLDAVILTTTPETHLALGLKAFDAGLHVMAEKPITLTVREGRELVNAARAAGRKLAVAENYRRDPINRLGKALLDSGAIGRPYLMVQASSGSGGYVIITPWRHLKTRGGIVVDMGVHYGDILEYYLGPLARVFGWNAVIDKQRVHRDDGSLHPADAEDLSVGVAQFQNGAMANWMLNLAGRGEGYFHRAIYGMGGSLIIPGDRRGQPLRLTQRINGKDDSLSAADLLNLVPDFALDDVTAALFGNDRLTAYDLPWSETDANLLAIEQADFVDAILNDRDPDVTGEQGLRSLAVVFGFLEAERLNRSVTIDEILSGETALYEQEIEAQT